MRRSISTSARRSNTSRCRKPLSSITLTAIPSISSTKGQGRQGKPQLDGRQTFVTTGETRGDQVAVLNGVKEGETIVTAGQIKLHNGIASDDQQFEFSPTADATPQCQCRIEQVEGHHEFHRYLHPPAGLATVVSLLILVLGLRA